MNASSCHGASCPNENQTFEFLRGMYADRDVNELWDLFVKCRGDVKWVVDVLLDKNDLKADSKDVLPTTAYNKKNNVYVWGLNLNGYVESVPPRAASEQNQAVSKTQRTHERVAYKKLNNFELKTSIERGFTFADALYPKRALIQRNRRPVLREESITRTATQAIQTDAGEEISSEGSEIVQVSVDRNLFQQLSTGLKSENSLGENSPLNETFQVCIPRCFARQLFGYCLEGVYSCAEEQRLQMNRKDEAFARLLKHPGFANLLNSPDNIQELLDREMALDVYNKQWEYKQRDNSAPVDLATHLTQMKLCETFPDINRNFLIDLLAANGNRYEQTVTVLNGALEVRTLEKSQLAQDLLETDQQTEKKQQQDQQRQDIDPMRKNFNPNELRVKALCDFEALRRMVKHHSQMQADCYSKAKQAMRQKKGGVAAYYSQAAKMHKTQVETLNRRAASCFIKAHKYSQNNPDLLDLHDLRLVEALNSVDIFIDGHIEELRATTKYSKYISVVTGRGLHSLGGISSIKCKVEKRLRERALTWTEEHPGLFKIKELGSEDEECI